jgi:salicylate hydroxylase
MQSKLKGFVRLSKLWQTHVMTPPPILIAGAGIAGLASALACRTHDCIVLERAPAFSPIGAGLQLGPNAVRALQKLRVWDAVEPFTSSPSAIHMRDGLNGKVMKILPLGQQFQKRYGAPYRVAHRADLHQALLKCVAQHSNIDVRLDVKISGVTPHLDHVAVTTNVATLNYQSLIATDGVNSFIRSALFAGATAIDSGFEFHRALLTLPTASMKNVALDCVNVWLYPHGHVVHYPVGEDQRLNIVAITPRGTSVTTHFSKACADLQNLLQLANNDWTLWSGLHAPALKSWTKGGVLLLGDAAHGTLPFLAQGAAMALEDAACLSEVLKSAHSLNHAFTETAARRKLRTTKLHHASLRAGHIYHVSGVTRRLRNAALMATPPSLITAGLDWIYNGD